MSLKWRRQRKRKVTRGIAVTLLHTENVLFSQAAAILLYRLPFDVLLRFTGAYGL